MARVTDAEVKEIIDTTIDTTPFITAANLVVTRVLGSSTELTSDELKEIERWLAAHFAAMRDKQAASLKVGSSSVTFQGKWGFGLDLTNFGQMVKVLDTTGAIAKAGGKRANFTVISEADVNSVGCDE